MTTDRDAAAVRYTGAGEGEGNWLADAHIAAFRAGWDAAMGEAAEAIPDEIDIYRIIKRSGARKHADIAKAVAATLPQPPASTGEGA